MERESATVPPLFVQEYYINRTEGYRFGESDVYETWTGDVGKLYRSLQREYGRCIGKVYYREGGPLAVGWVFLQRLAYEDSSETYLRETWVTVHDAQPERSAPVFAYHAI